MDCYHSGDVSDNMLSVRTSQASKIGRFRQRMLMMGSRRWAQINKTSNCAGP